MHKCIPWLLISVMVAFAWGVTVAPVSSQQRGGAANIEKGGVGEIVGPYQLPDLSWPQWAYSHYPDEGYIWGSQGGVFAESPDRVFLANRGELKLPERMPAIAPALGGGKFPGYWGAFGFQAANEVIARMRNIIVVLDGDGNLIEAWNQWDHLFKFGRGPHSIYISPYDPERHVWVVDDFRHAIFKFTNDGRRLVQTLGVPGEFTTNDDLTHFRRPTAIDFRSDGTFYVSDGYENTRVVKFDRTGKPLMKWGTRGTGPAQFNGPHGVAVSSRTGNVYVSDRGNSRIQVFDENGRYLDQWPGVRANNVAMSADEQHVWVVDIGDDRIIQYDLNGRVLQAWGQFGQKAGYTWCPHQGSADSEGNLYIAECFNGRTQKFVPKPGVAPARLWRAKPMMASRGSR